MAETTGSAGPWSVSCLRVGKCPGKSVYVYFKKVFSPKYLVLAALRHHINFDRPFKDHIVFLKNDFWRKNWLSIDRSVMHGLNDTPFDDE